VPPTTDTWLVVFEVDGRRLALEIAGVERVLRMVALDPLPRAPAVIAGVFDLHGELVPVVDVRHRLRLPERPWRAADQLLVVRARRGRLALAVERVATVAAVDAGAIRRADETVPGLEYLRGVVPLPAEGVVFVHDLDAFLSLAEEAKLAAALEAANS